MKDSAHLITADGKPISLRIDPVTGTRTCAAFWPEQSGWHRLQQGEQTHAFYVRAAGSAMPMQAFERQQATRQLVMPSAHVQNAGRGLPHRGPSWPWFLAWLVCATLLWWFERSRRKPVQKS